MDFSTVLSFMQEFTYALVVLGIFLWFAIYRGRQATINLIFGLYFALLFTQHSPFTITTADSQVTAALITIGIFIAMTVGATYVVAQLMPDGYREKRFESFGKKVFLAFAATVLVLLFSFHILPVANIVTLSSPISGVFASTEYFFWLLVTPFILLYFHR